MESTVSEIARMLRSMFVKKFVDCQRVVCNFIFDVLFVLVYHNILLIFFVK